MELPAAGVLDCSVGIPKQWSEHIASSAKLLASLRQRRRRRLSLDMYNLCSLQRLADDQHEG